MDDLARSRREWVDARRTAFLHDALGALARGPVYLPSFRHVRCACGVLLGVAHAAEVGYRAAQVFPRPGIYECPAREMAAVLGAARDGDALAQRVYRALGVPSLVRMVESQVTDGNFDSELAVAWFSRWLS